MQVQAVRARSSVQRLLWKAFEHSTWKQSSDTHSENPWKMCLHSATGPGKPHMGSPRSVDVYVLLPQPPAPTPREWGTLSPKDCITGTQPSHFHFSTGFPSSQDLLHCCLFGPNTISIARELHAMVKSL